MTKTLKLLAHDKADLDVISAVLQDAVMTVGEMTYLPAQHRFAAVANRFLWEEEHGHRTGRRKLPTGRRIRTGLHFDDVMKAEMRNIPRRKKDHVLSLLAVTAKSEKDKTAIIDLNFSGGGTIRLTVECINATLMDMTDAWPALRKPQHDTD